MLDSEIVNEEEKEPMGERLNIHANDWQNWDLAKQLHGWKPGHDLMNNCQADIMAWYAQNSMIVELNLLGKTHCAICDGRGHSHKVCPTNRKLKHFSKAGVSQTIMKRVKDNCKALRSRVNLGEVAPWSCLPLGGMKRPHNMIRSV